MSKLREAAENIKRLSVMFKGIVELGEEIEKVSALEEYCADLERIRDAKLLEIADVEKQKAEAAEYCSAADKYGKEVIEKANAEASAMAAKAMQDSERIVDEARGEAVLAAAEAKGEEMRAKEELAKVNVDLEQLKLLVADESAKLEAVQSKLAEIRGSI